MDVVILGAGRMGSQIGCEYALAGHHVTWLVRNATRAEEAIEAATSVAVASGLATVDEVAAAGARASIRDSISAIEHHPEIVVESVAEVLELKGELLGECAQRWPDAILASNTSSIEIGHLGAAASAPARVVGTHYWSPPLLMPLVEVIAGPETSPAVVQRVSDVLEQIGKRVVHAQRDVPGFIWNRLQFALLREALWLVDNDVATAEVVDLVVREGLARRWTLAGPFETAELGGIETFAAISALLFPQLSTASEAPSLRERPSRDPEGLAQTRARRDQALAAILRSERASLASTPG